MRYFAQIELHTQTNDETTLRILHMLRNALNAADEWELHDEGTWEEFTRPGGVCYVVRTEWESAAKYLEAAEEVARYVEDLESRVYALGGSAYADGEAGMYFVSIP